jgi:hypothetical protein
MHGRRWALIFACAAGLGLCQAQPPPFELQLTCLAGVWFPPGIVQVPRSACGALEVRLSKFASARVKSSDLGFAINSRYLKHETRSGEDGYVLAAQGQGPEDLLRAPENELKAEVGHSSAVWQVRKWDKPYIETTSVKDSLPPDIRIAEPTLPVIRTGSGKVVIAGSVSPADGVSVTLQGQPLTRLVDQPGFQFRATVTLADDIREIVLSAVDRQGNRTTLVWPVQGL